MNCPGQNIYKTADYHFSTDLQRSQQSLTLKITKLSPGLVSKIFHVHLTHDHLQKCSVSDFKQIIDYMRENQKHFQIDFEQRYFKIMQMVGINKKYKQLIKLPLEQQDIEYKIDKIEDIKKRCEMEYQLSCRELKNFFIKIIEQMEERKIFIESSKQVIDSVINKFTAFGQRNQNIEKKLVDYRQSLQTIRGEKQKQNRLTLQKLQKFNLQINLEIEMIKLQIEQISYNLTNKYILQEKDQGKDQKKQKSKQKYGQKYKNQKKQKKNQLILEQAKSIKPIKLMEQNKVQKKFSIFLQNQEDELQNIHIKLQPAEKNTSSNYYSQQQQISNNLYKKQQSTYKLPINKNKITDQLLFPQAQYKITNRTIQKIKQDSYEGLCSKLTIEKSPIMKLKIIKTQSWGITVGIRNIQTSETIQYGGNGWLNNISQFFYKKGIGINSGDIVTVSVSKQEAQIKFLIQNQNTEYKYTTSCQNNKIKSTQYQWVRYITLSQKDIVQIL